MIASLSDDSKQSARQHIDRFVQRFDASYRRLAYYAALPLVLTPDLLNYLRNQFLRGEVPWVAEIDLLLSELCSPTGYEQYVMETAVRAVLLEEMEQVLGRSRMEAVAKLLIDYVRKLARTTPQINQRSLQTQQWAAMVYLDDQRQTAVAQIARSLQNALPERVTAGAGLSVANQAELAQLTRITQELAPQLGNHPEVLEFAGVVSQLLVDRTAVSPERLERSYVVEGVELRVPVAEFIVEQTNEIEIALHPELEERSRHPVSKKILILASNPRRDLNLDREVRNVQDVLQRSGENVLEVNVVRSARLEDLQESLLRYRPQIVHFSGHGTGEQGLLFETNEGREQIVSTEALSALFKLFSNQVECVLLNTSYSEVQANALVQHINYAIGMRQAILDNAAIAFAKGFYMALSYGYSIEQSYELGCNAIQLETSDIPEYSKPILKKRRSLNTVSGSEVLSSATRTVIQAAVDKTLESENDNRKQYRDRVREYLSDRKLSNFERIRLEQLRENLGLTAGEANQVVTEEYEPIQRSQEEYREVLSQLIEAGDYPFNAEVNHELQLLREELGLTDAEVETISKPILEAAESTILNNASQSVSTIGRSNPEADPPPQSDRSSDLTSARSTKSSPTTILFLAANPVGTSHLRLDQERRELEDSLKLSRHHDRFRLEPRRAVRLRDVQRAMLDVNPQILHFSGHGEWIESVGEAGSTSTRKVMPEDGSTPQSSQTATSGLVFEDEAGKPNLISGEALAGLFRLFANQVECVVLNGCYSAVQAEVIAQHISYVIGMPKAIGDRGAIEFAIGFYDALGAGRDIEFAYEFGCASIGLESIPEHSTPVLLKRNSR